MSNYDEILKAVEERLGDNYDISLKTILKNNGIMRTGLIIKSPDSNVSPTIYLDEFKDLSIQEIADKVVEIYITGRHPSIDLQEFCCFDNVRTRVIPKLINRERNAELLKAVPYVEWLDLAIIFQVFISQMNCSMASATVTNEHLKMWNTSVDELYENAKRNSEILCPHKIIGLEEIVGIVGPFKILTNMYSVNGAYYMTCNYIFKSFTENLKSDILILPSSIHECLLITDFGFSVDELKEMVFSVNRDNLKPDDFLSDSVYRYHHNENYISRA